VRAHLTALLDGTKTHPTLLHDREATGQLLTVTSKQSQKGSGLAVATARRESQQDQTRHRSAVSDGKVTEVLVLCDENAILGAAECQYSIVISASIRLEHVVNIMSCCPKRGHQAWIAALVEEQPHGSASTTASSAR
jgi:hypothetical protein